MAYRLACPCTQLLFGRTAAEIVQVATDHARTVHSRQYSADQVMFMAIEVPESFLPEEMHSDAAVHEESS